MSLYARVTLLSVGSLILLGQSACTMVPKNTLRYSQLRTLQMHNQNKALAMERERLAAEREALAQSLSTASARVDNLNRERSQLQEKYLSLLNRNKQANPMDAETSRRMQELAKKYPGFEFDPATGISKFEDDILFPSGSDQIRPDGQKALREFAGIINQGTAGDLNILVVGHTDDQRIARSSTRSRHPTNWHLSTDRAAAVVTALSKNGVKESRMAIGGHSKYQPVVANKDSTSRQKNRRVEIFVLSPSAVVAGWDPATSRN